MNRQYTKLKTLFLYGLLTLIVLFCAVWLVDICSNQFNPEYRSLLWFLQIVNSLLQTAIGL